MPISYPLTTILDLPGFVQFTWEHESSVAIQENEFSYHQTLYDWGGQRRKATVQVRELAEESQAIEWQVFILKLNGRWGTFLMQDPVSASHKGNFNLSDVYIGKVKGAGQTGSDLLTDGWDTGMAEVLKRGDWIAIGNRLHRILDDVDADGAGEAILSIWPHAHLGLADNAEISVGEQAWGTFRLIDAPPFSYDKERVMTGFTFNCQEAF